MHEGVDILSLKKDARGEPTDPVRASASGTVAYVNRRPGLSNYGIYVVLRHRIEGLEVFTVYAHLREARSHLKAGTRVRAGETLGVVGRTTNTRTPIAKYRAHLHFEIGLFVNDNFPAWLKKQEPGTRDDHGAWNGRNLLGLDPAEIFRLQEKAGAAFSLLAHLRNQTEMCRVLVADTTFPWLKRYPALIRRNATAERNGIVAYEVSLNYNGVPFRLVPRSRAEIKGTVATRILDVDEAEFARHRCRKLIFKKGQSWILTARGQSLVQLLTH
ncbi:MAG: M23 family metallopeptidase [Limisphaerales bacterium]